MSETLAPTIHTLSFLTGRDGDITYGWDANDDEWVVPMIQRKMDEGYVFWIVQKNPLREVRLRNVNDAMADRSVIMKDARILFEQGRIGIASQDSADVVRERRADTAAEAAANDTVAHPRPVGG